MENFILIQLLALLKTSLLPSLREKQVDMLWKKVITKNNPRYMLKNDECTLKKLFFIFAKSCS